MSNLANDTTKHTQLNRKDALSFITFYSDTRCTIQLGLGDSSSIPQSTLHECRSEQFRPIACALEVVGATHATVYPKNGNLNSCHMSDSDFSRAKQIPLVTGDSNQFQAHLGLNQVVAMISCLRDWSRRFADRIQEISDDKNFNAASGRLEHLKILCDAYLKCEEMEKLSCSLSGGNPTISSTTLSPTGSSWMETHGELMSKLAGFTAEQNLLLFSANEQLPQKQRRAQAIAHVKEAGENLSAALTAAPMLSPLHTLPHSEALKLAIIVAKLMNEGNKDPSASQGTDDLATQVVDSISQLIPTDRAIEVIVKECTEFISKNPPQKQIKKLGR